MVNDTISDMLTRIRNANNAKHHLVEIPTTKMTKSIIQIFKEEGFIENFELLEDPKNPTMLISLKYIGKTKKSVITHLERISKPGLRKYTNAKNMPSILGNLGIAVISTSQGIMTDAQAKKLNIGGEFLCKVY
jgi:small subunit ribosomal protein S8|tara:strand:+ start:8453 stop:8851 length:399 start_codon:yes stop_codon:yes gene_type:complete